MQRKSWPGVRSYKTSPQSASRFIELHQQSWLFGNVEQLCGEKSLAMQQAHPRQLFTDRNETKYAWDTFVEVDGIVAWAIYVVSVRYDDNQYLQSDDRPENKCSVTTSV